MKKALVTGSQGFVGRHMMTHLASNGWDVDGIDIWYHDVEMDGRGCEYLGIARHDLSDRRYDLVVHAAAAGPNRQAIDTQPRNFPYNVMLDSSMLEWAVQTKQRHFVYLSSCAVYPVDRQRGNTIQALREEFVDPFNCEEPADTYGMTKLIGERMVDAIRNYTTKITVVRPFSGYGEDQSTDFPFARFVRRAKDWQDPFSIWGSSEQVRDWIHIDDVVAGIMAAVEANVKTTNLCTGRGVSMLTLATMMTDTAGYHSQFYVIKDAPLGVMWRVGDPTFMKTFYTPKIELEEGVARAFRGWKR